MSQALAAKKVDWVAAFSSQWVAILGGELVAHAATLKEVLAQLEETPPHGRPLIFLAGSEAEFRNEVPLLPKSGNGLKITMELVNRLRDEE